MKQITTQFDPLFREAHFCAYAREMHASLLPKMGRKRADPGRDIRIYRLGQELHESTRCKPRPYTWHEIWKYLSELFSPKNRDERECILFIPAPDGMYYKVMLPVYYLMAKFEPQRTALSPEAVRSAFRRGKHLVELIEQKEKDNPNLFPPAVELIRKDKFSGKRVVEIKPAK